MAFNEDRQMQDLYKDQQDPTLYNAAREEVAKDRHLYEENSKIERRTVTNGNAHKGRRQDGVEVLRGNPNKVFSDTKGDGTRHRYYPTGVATVNEEASKINGAPITPPPEEIPFEKTVGSLDTMEGEV